MAGGKGWHKDYAAHAKAGRKGGLATQARLRAKRQKAAEGTK